MWRHKWSTIWRCILYQLIYASYLAQTQTFYKGTGNYGPGKAVAMQPLDANLLGLKLVVATASQDARDFVATALSAAGVSGTANVVHVDSPDQVTTLCPENFNAISPCFAGLVVENLDTKTGHLVSSTPTFCLLTISRTTPSAATLASPSSTSRLPRMTICRNASSRCSGPSRA